VWAVHCGMLYSEIRVYLGYRVRPDLVAGALHQIYGDSIYNFAVVSVKSHICTGINVYDVKKQNI
jgi:hypothetical protein